MKPSKEWANWLGDRRRRAEKLPPSPLPSARSHESPRHVLSHAQLNEHLQVLRHRPGLCQLDLLGRTPGKHARSPAGRGHRGNAHQRQSCGPAQHDVDADGARTRPHRSAHLCSAGFQPLFLCRLSSVVISVLSFPIDSIRPMPVS